MYTPDNNKRKRDESGRHQEEQGGVNLRYVRRQWTPERGGRFVKGTKKVRSADDGPLMGSDWVLNDQGGGATLAFCFENSEGTEAYGLTVGHLTERVGDSLFRFAESEPVPVPDDAIDEEKYFMFEIGPVTSISRETDSLVFKIDLEKGEYSPMQIALSSQSKITLNENLLSLAKIPTMGSGVVGFGAQRRGANCTVVIPSQPSPGEYSFAGDIGLESAVEATDAATDGGDCGTIFFSLEDGAPVYFHHVLSSLSDGTQISLGVPLLEVLSAHEESRHLVPASFEARKRASPKDKKSKSCSGPLPEEAHEIAGLRQFQTEVVDRPTSDPSSKDAFASKEVSTAPSQLNGGGDSGTEDQTLPVFNVRTVAKKATRSTSK